MPIKGRFCDITADHSHNKKADHTLTVPSLVCLVLDTTSSGYDLCKAFQGVDCFMNRRWKKKRKKRENKDKIAAVQKLWIVKKNRYSNIHSLLDIFVGVYLLDSL